MSDINLVDDREAHRARKRPVQLEVVFATEPGTLATREGDAVYERGDALITGTEGERWPVARARFDPTYEPVPPLRAGRPGRYSKRPILVWAKTMRAPLSVELDEGRGSLRAQPGDWLVQYGKGDFGVVSASVFAQTYELLD
ncbi:MAG: PGDYG domain-containing protein [Betaproteobacteria bacterium]